MRGIDALMRRYRRLEKLEMYVQLHTVQYCICRHRIMCTRSYGRPACHRYQLILLDLPKNLPIKVRWARQAGRFVVGRILADSQGRHLLHVCFGHARTPFLPPCSMIAWREDRFADEPDESLPCSPMLSLFAQTHTQLRTLIQCRALIRAAPTPTFIDGQRDEIMSQGFAQGAQSLALPG